MMNFSVLSLELSALWCRGFALLSLLGIAALLTGCGSNPVAPDRWSAEQIIETIAATNLDHPVAGGGRLTRWRMPIFVATNNIARANDALDHCEAWTGGLVRFTRVSGMPTDGILFVEGGALKSDGSDGCAHLTDTLPPNNSPVLRVRRDSTGGLIGVYAIHLGSSACDDQNEGQYHSAMAEHELGRALGMFGDFSGFTGKEGLADAHAFTVLYNIYANPIGVTRDALIIWPVR